MALQVQRYSWIQMLGTWRGRFCLLMQGAFVDWDGARDGHVVLEGAEGRRVLSGSCLSLTQLVRDSTLSRVLW